MECSSRLTTANFQGAGSFLGCLSLSGVRQVRRIQENGSHLSWGRGADIQLRAEKRWGGLSPRGKNLTKAGGSSRKQSSVED